jgi:RNA polymerase sigma-70 factor (ECF subfamily)
MRRAKHPTAETQIVASASPSPSQGPFATAGEQRSDRLTPLREMQLVEAHRAGDQEALGTLLEAYQRRVYSVCYRMLQNVDDAAELTHDALVKVIEGMGSYDGRARLSTWIISIAMNCCLSHLRKQRLRRHASLDEPGVGGGTPIGHKLVGEREPSAAQRVEQDERRAVLLKGLSGLEPQMRAILVLRDLQELEYQQIGEVLDIPVGTVKSRLFRARAALRAETEASLRDFEEQEP